MTTNAFTKEIDNVRYPIRIKILHLRKLVPAHSSFPIPQNQCLSKHHLNLDISSEKSA